MRRDDRVTVQGPVKRQQPDGMSHQDHVDQAIAEGQTPPPSPRGPRGSEAERTVCAPRLGLRSRAPFPLTAPVLPPPPPPHRLPHHSTGLSGPWASSSPRPSGSTCRALSSGSPSTDRWCWSCRRPEFTCTICRSCASPPLPPSPPLEGHWASTVAGLGGLSQGGARRAPTARPPPSPSQRRARPAAA